MILFSYLVVIFLIVFFALYIWLYTWNLFNINFDDEESWYE
tara:strand:+ start:595 stop:717 length:123 start_codon:yes stop_codon:yes gene_type:complete